MKILSALAVLLLLSSCGNAGDIPGGTIVQLFEWKWADVARECEEFLGPKGYAAVQVSPPQEHVKGPQWWTRYQPVSYQITSRGGSREQFADMVHRCRAAGVDIYVDAVINHMSGVGNGVGVAGNTYYEYNYPAVPYSSTDFHYCGTPGNDIDDYEDRYEVRNCELLNLADLATGKDYVRGKIAGYLNDLFGMGVAGYRIDAAKHIDPWDLYAISKRLNGKPYIFQEVVNIDLSDPVRPSEYFSIGDVTEFNYGLNLSVAIRDKSKMKDLKDFAEGSMFIPGDKSVVFVSNHDTERSDWEVLTFRDTKLFELANVFMLAYPYGYPKVMSSFDFPANDTDQGPPSYSPYSGNKIHCGKDKAWKCQHRWKAIANMVKFRYTTRIAPVTNWFSKHALIAFGRDDRGFVVINREDREITATYSTNMRPGMYCNVIKGEFSEGKCLDEALLVDKNSKVQITVPALSAAAIHIDAQIFPTSGFTQMYVRGTFNNWGIMPMKLVHGNIWLAEKVSFKGSQKPEFKFDVYGDWKLNYGDNNEDFIGDRSGKNIRVPETLVSTVAIGFNDDSKKYSIAPTSSASGMVEGLKGSKEEL